MLRKTALATVAMLFALTSLLFAAEALQTQEADLWDGLEGDLTSVRVKNNIITIKLKLRNVGTEKHSVKIFYDEAYIMDETNQKKYYALKDSDGLYIAGPSADDNRGGRFWYTIEPQRSKNMWIKFPHPTENPEMVTLSIPGFPPFEEISLPQ